MILTDTEILKNIENGSIEIEPFRAEFLGSNSYDVHLGDKLLVCMDSLIDPKKAGKWREATIPDEGFVLLPNELYLASTIERTYTPFHVPDIDGKSSIGRLGISIHQTAGKGDIGFNGHWTLEITVVKPTVIYSGMPIGQIRFFTVFGDCKNRYKKSNGHSYQNQEARPKPSMLWSKPEKFL